MYNMNYSLFEPQLFGKVFSVTQTLAMIGLVISFAIFGTLAVRDIVGTFISAGIVAYMAHLWIAYGREQ
jgi:hypothetical protein